MKITSPEDLEEFERMEQRIQELEAENQRLREIGNKVCEMAYLIDGTMDEKDMNNLWDAINKLQKALEE